MVEPTPANRFPATSEPCRPAVRCAAQLLRIGQNAFKVPMSSQLECQQHHSNLSSFLPHGALISMAPSVKLHLSSFQGIILKTTFLAWFVRWPVNKMMSTKWWPLGTVPFEHHTSHQSEISLSSSRAPAPRPYGTRNIQQLGRPVNKMKVTIHSFTSSLINLTEAMAATGCTSRVQQLLSRLACARKFRQIELMTNWRKNPCLHMLAEPLSAWLLLGAGS